MAALSSDLTHLHSHLVLNQEAKKRARAELDELNRQLKEATVL